MPTFMNSYEVDDVRDYLVGTPAGRFAKFLADWRDTIDANSDGWAYWKVGHKAGGKLTELLQTAVCVKRDLRAGLRMPTDAEFTAALRPIRAAATRHGLTAPTLEEVAPASANESADDDEPSVGMRR